MTSLTGVKVSEVAHDYHVGIRKYVTDELGIFNSYDTWHGEYCTAIWVSLCSPYFCLCSERRSKVHLYYCMTNCGGSPEESIMRYLRALSGTVIK